VTTGAKGDGRASNGKGGDDNGKSKQTKGDDKSKAVTTTHQKQKRRVNSHVLRRSLFCGGLCLYEHRQRNS
jgi:hypothetical protein